MATKPKAAARAKVAKTQGTTDQAVVAAPGLFVLKKNHGLIMHGRASKFFEAGTTFDPATDGELISHLVRAGALMEEMAAESVEESPEQTGETNLETNSQSNGDGKLEDDKSDKQE